MCRAWCKLLWIQGRTWKKWLLLLGVDLIHYSALGSQVWSLSPFHPWGEWRSKSMHWCCHSADRCFTIPDLWLSKPLSFPLCLLPLCLLDVVTFFFFLLTSRLIFLMLLNVSFLSCFSIAYSHFNYILLIAFCRWASYVFLFLPLVLKWCLHLLRCVCFAPASRSY